MNKTNISKNVKIFLIAISAMTALAIALIDHQVGNGAKVKADISSTTAANYGNFEGPQVHPICLTPDRAKLLAVNTPNNHLSVFQLDQNGLPTSSQEIPVGVEPVSVAARNNSEAWVVNWISDSVSIVNLDTGNVVNTINVGDEPTDILFTGSPTTANERAFVAVSGLNRVNVYDLSHNNPLPTLVNIPGKQPRSLSCDAKGTMVFVSIFLSGNRTAAISDIDLQTAGGPPPIPSQYNFNPPVTPNLNTVNSAPNTGIIVKNDKTTGAWHDDSYVYNNGKPDGINWSVKVSALKSINPLDNDLAIIKISNLTAKPQTLTNIGTNIGNSAFNSTTNRLYVANTDSNNNIRFEPVLRGRFATNRVSQVDGVGTTSTKVTTVDLNPTVMLNNTAGTPEERATSLALPSDIVIDAKGNPYVAAMGSALVGKLDNNGNVIARYSVGKLPTGLAINNQLNRLYVLNRYDDSINIINLTSGQVSEPISIGFNPEPTDVREGRVILYDATLSAHGTVSCATCHRNGERDDLSWDLGDPTASQPFPTGIGFNPLPGGKEATVTFHPMKGIMNTQTLRGLAADGNVLVKGYSFITGPVLHWRGDRPNSQSGIEMPLTSPLNLMDPFNGAFVSLLGGPRELDATELQQFNAFVASMIYPPNPNENLDRTYADAGQNSPSAYRGYLQFISGTAQIGATKSVTMQCTACHEVANFGPGTNGLIDPTADADASHPGGLTKQPFKIPQLRNFYKKDGLTRTGVGSTSGFGYGHEGSSTQLENIDAPNFNFGPTNSQARLDVRQFLLSLDTGTAPAVGSMVTVNGGNKSSVAVTNQINLLMKQADATNCDLVVNGIYRGAQQEFVYTGSNNFRSNNGQTVTLQNLLQSAGNGSELTFTGVLYGKGTL